MKKVLLSLSMLAAVMSANAQIQVGAGANDDMATVGNAVDNPTGEYSTPITDNGTDYTAGIFWWKDTAPANANDYTLTRANGVLTVAVTKGEAYSPIGLGFGDTEGDGSGTEFSIDMTNAQTISFDAMAGTDAPSLYFQVSDANGINGEIKAAGSGDEAKFGVAALTATMTTYTFDLTGMMGQTGAATMWPCVAWPTDCPDRTLATAVDFSKIVKVSFFISGGAEYTGTVTLDNVKVGTSGSLGLGTASAASNIGSTKVFPNPATASFTAEVNLNNASNTTIIVTDMLGKQVASQNLGTVSASSAVFNTSALAKGMYTVTYVLDGTPAKTELVVVK